MKWNKQTCLADSKRYATRSEWAKESSSAYQAARRNGWLDECCEHMGKGSSSTWSEKPKIVPLPTKSEPYENPVDRLKILLKIK